MKKFFVVALIAVALALASVATACKEPEPEGDGTTPHVHTYGTAWKSNATQHWHECTANDGAKTDIADHDWEWVITPATIQAEGQETETCKTCGATRGTRTIAKLQTEFPITGGAYTVIIKDGRTSEATETLEDLGVITKFEALLEAGVKENGAYGFIAPRGLMIVVESGVDYEIYKAIDGNTMGANLTWVLTTANFAGALNRGIFTAMVGEMVNLTFTQR